MDWETYYERYSDWAESTQIRRIASLKTFGPSEEIAEVVQNIWNEPAASRLIKKALSAGVRFTAEEICDIKEFVDQETLQRIVRNAKTSFTEEQAEDMDGWVDTDTYNLICPQCHEPEPVTTRAPKTRWGLIFGLGLLSALFGSEKKKHSGHCDGDCANCPPHYGYRYGRWYYGHDHVHGCEFGGNKASGSMD